MEQYIYGIRGNDMLSDYTKNLILMHKNIPVAKMQFINNKPCQYIEIYDKLELPIGTEGSNQTWQKRFIEEWIKSRSIPGKRINISKIEEKLGLDRAEMFLKNAGVSLTDTYWFKDEKDDINWEDVNFYKNKFEPVFACLYTDGNIVTSHKTPDYTTDGIMEKFWIMPEDKPLLVKIDNKTKNVLCANEVVFTKIAEFSGVKVTPYSQININNGTYGCICPDFIDNENQDAVTALQLRFEDPKRCGEKQLDYISSLGFEKEIREMMTLDCLLHNKDRHEKNFGLIYENNTAVKFIPLFDQGGILGGTSAEYVLTSGEFPKKTDSDMMIVPWSREEILKNYGCELNIDEVRFNTILKSTYEQFNVPEILYELAKRELDQGVEIYNDYLKFDERSM